MRVAKFFDRHIDLDSITAITDAYFIDRMGYGGYFVGFQVELKLHDKPWVYQRELTSSELRWNSLWPQGTDGYHELLLPSGNWIKARELRDKNVCQAVGNLQVQLNELIEEWKNGK